MESIEKVLRNEKTFHIQITISRKLIIHMTYDPTGIHIGICTCCADECGQVNVIGSRLEEGSKEHLTGASVILRNAKGKIKKVCDF